MDNTPVISYGGHVVLGRIIRIIYHWMQKHYVTFRILVWLKEIGVTRRVNHFLMHKNESKERETTTAKMIESQNFFMTENNEHRATEIMKLLADQKSKEVLKSCIEYRTRRIPISESLYSENDQYFVDEIIKLSKNEVFIDGGAYTGDTIQQLFDLAKKKKVIIKKVIAFEPDKNNYQILSRFYGKRKNVVLYNMGLSEKKGTLFFKSDGAAARIVGDENDSTNKVNVINIDSLNERDFITFIKMDIEGAEWEALHGARNVIVQNKPKLTICIYHSDEDMLRIIGYVHELVPEYKLFVRHHSKGNVETVLYAVP